MSDKRKFKLPTFLSNIFNRKKTNQETNDEKSMHDSKETSDIPVDQMLDTSLQEYGLDSKFWIGQLGKINITKHSQLKTLMDEESFNDLLEFAEDEKTLKSYEPKRLRKCFGLPEVGHERPDFKDDSSMLDETENEQESCNSGGPLEPHSKKYSSGDNMTDIDLVQSISGGMVLKGLYLNRKRKTISKCKQQLLDCPKNVKLLAPKLTGKTEEIECYNKEEADELQHCLKHGGHSYAASLGGGTHGLLAKLSVGHKKEVSNETSSQKQTHTNFASKTSYTVIPTKAVALNKDDCFLSITAINALKEIEKYLVYDKSIINEKCEDFFKKFGSHFYTGTIHLGGIYQKTATLKIDKAILISEASNMCEKALRTRIKATYNAGLASASGGVGASRTRGLKSGEEKKVTSEDSNVKITESKIGGPQAASGIKSWKEGLISMRDTWQIIDMEEETVNTVHGVWKLILRSTTGFEQPIALAITLLEAWKSIARLASNADNHFYIDLLDRTLKNLTDRYDEDYRAPHYQNELLQTLKALDEITNKIKKHFVVDDIWVKKCSADTKSILQNVKTNSSMQDVCQIAERLLEKATKPVASTKIKTIMDQLIDARKRLNSVNICDVVVLNELQTEMTKELEKSIKGLHDADLLQFIFFVGSLQDIGDDMFDLSKMCFQHDLAQHNIKSLIENSERCCDDFSAFDTVIRGDFHTIYVVRCLRRLISSLRFIADEKQLSEYCLDYLSEDTRTQAFLEVTSINLSKTKGTEKSYIIDLIMGLIDTEKGIGLKRWNVIIDSLMAEVVSDEQEDLLLTHAIGLRGRSIKLMKLESFNANISNGDIAGLDITDAGNIVLGDKSNGDIKLFSSTGKLLSVYKLHHMPPDLAILNDEEVAVATVSNKILVLRIDENQQLSLKHSIVVGTEIKLITQIVTYNNHLILCSVKDNKNDEVSVAMITLDGNIIWTITKDKDDKNIFNKFDHLTIQHDKNGIDRVVVAGAERNTGANITFLAAQTGEILKVLNKNDEDSESESEPDSDVESDSDFDDDFKITGVAADDAGRVYVSCDLGLFVYYPSIDTIRMLEVKDGEIGPMCFNKALEQLVLARENNVVIYKIKPQ